jgi:hypothetical protein
VPKGNIEIDCKEVWMQISSYLDDELPPELRATMAAHFKGMCPLYRRLGRHTQCGSTSRRRTRFRGSRRGWPTVDGRPERTGRITQRPRGTRIYEYARRGRCAAESGVRSITDVASVRGRKRLRDDGFSLAQRGRALATATFDRNLRR